MPFLPFLNNEVSHLTIQRRLVLAEGLIEDLQRECEELQIMNKRLCSESRKIRHALRMKNDEYEGMHMERQGLKFENECLKQKVVNLERSSCGGGEQDLDHFVNNRSVSTVTTTETPATMSDQEDSDCFAELDISIVKTRSFLSQMRGNTRITRRRRRRRRRNQQRQGESEQEAQQAQQQPPTPYEIVGTSLDSCSSTLVDKYLGGDTSLTTTRTSTRSTVMTDSGSTTRSSRLLSSKEQSSMSHINSSSSLLHINKHNTELSSQHYQQRSSMRMEKEEKLRMLSSLQSMVVPPKSRSTGSNRSSCRTHHQHSATMTTIMNPTIPAPTPVPALRQNTTTGSTTSTSTRTTNHSISSNTNKRTMNRRGPLVPKRFAQNIVSSPF